MIEPETTHRTSIYIPTDHNQVPQHNNSIRPFFQDILFAAISASTTFLRRGGHLSRACFTATTANPFGLLTIVNRERGTLAGPLS
jgi:hypothetical protein